MKYIVLWIIISSTNYSPEPQPDEFGFYSNNTTLSIAYIKSVKKTYSKEFNSRDSAFAFYNEGLKKVFDKNDIRNSFYNSKRIHYIKIDSIK